MVVEGNAGLDVEDGGVRVALQISGDEVVLGIGENACICQQPRRREIIGMFRRLPLSSFSEASLMAFLISS